MTTDIEPSVIIEECQFIKGMIAGGERHFGQGADCFIEAGRRLLKLKEGKTQREWLPAVQEHIGISKTTAYRLMSLAEGKTTLPQYREEWARANAKRIEHAKYVPVQGQLDDASTGRAVAVIEQEATEEDGDQDEIVARGPREILLKAQELRAVLTEQRREQRIARAVELSAHNAPLPSDRKYSLILADPPWRYEFSKTSTRAIEANYPTMSIEEVCTLPVSDLAAPIAVLFLWVPPAILEQGFAVIRSWGFTFASGCVWDKGSPGLGFYFRQQHEHLLVATRGDVPAPPPHARQPSVIQAPRREHSQKPDEAYELIERMYPDLPKIELFARGAREGWAAWGNQAPSIVPEQAAVTMERAEVPLVPQIAAPPIAVDLDDIPDICRRTTSPQPA